MLKRLFRRPRFELEAHQLYTALVQQARLPAFYQELEVPDTPEGRFEMVVLHTFLVINRLNADIERTRDLSQQLFDVLFGDMDSALRELGVGDIGVGKRIKRMVESFYGRVAAYEAGLKSQNNDLQAALDRNVYPDVTPGPKILPLLEEYVRLQHNQLASQSLDEVVSGRVDFGGTVPGTEN